MLNVRKTVLVFKNWIENSLLNLHCKNAIHKIYDCTPCCRLGDNMDHRLAKLHWCSTDGVISRLTVTIFSWVLDHLVAQVSRRPKCLALEWHSQALAWHKQIFSGLFPCFLSSPARDESIVAAQRTLWCSFFFPPLLMVWNAFSLVCSSRHCPFMVKQGCIAMPKYVFYRDVHASFNTAHMPALILLVFCVPTRRYAPTVKQSTFGLKGLLYLYKTSEWIFCQGIESLVVTHKSLVT